MATMVKKRVISMTVNGKTVQALAEPRKSLADFLREDIGLTGTHLGCEQGVCGACNVIVDGKTMRSCLLFAVQAEGAVIETVEGLTAKDGTLSPLQQAFVDNHGLQCGFCTPGILMAMGTFLQENDDPTDEEIRVALSGNICRCTGYQDIVASIKDAARRLHDAKAGD